ncbi:MAG: ArsR/SmtB family transcription factor [Dehalococcoidia bacterium]
MHAFAALADPTREEIVQALAERPRTVNEVVALFPISQPAISRHLKVLREAGLVRVQPEGKTRVYHLDPAPLQEIDSWLDRYRKFWAGRLDALERHLEANP